MLVIHFISSNPNISDFEILEENEFFKVRRIEHKMPWPIYPRETVFTQHKIEEIDEHGNDLVWLVGYSVNHNKAPYKSKENVRTDVHMSVYKFRQISPNKTEVSRVAQVDPCGLIPKVVIDMKAGNAMATFKRWMTE